MLTFSGKFWHLVGDKEIKKTSQKAAEEFICQVVDEIPPQSLVQGAGQIQSARVAHG